MGSMTIRQLDLSTKMRLRLRAARHGRSMEAEAREVLKQALATGEAEPTNLADSIRQTIRASDLRPTKPLEPPLTKWAFSGNRLDNSPFIRLTFCGL